MSNVININRERMIRDIEKLTEVECDPEKINETEKLIHQITNDLFEWVHSTKAKPTKEVMQAMDKVFKEWIDSKKDWCKDND